MGSSALHNEHLRKVLAKNVKAFLALTELSENALAQKCKISQKQVNKITNARTGCGIDALYEMASVFGCEPWQLIFEGMEKSISHHQRLSRLVSRYSKASESDQDLIENVASKTTR